MVEHSPQIQFHTGNRPESRPFRTVDKKSLVRRVLEDTQRFSRSGDKRNGKNNRGAKQMNPKMMETITKKLPTGTETKNGISIEVVKSKWNDNQNPNQ